MSMDILEFFLFLMNPPTKEDVSNKNITSLAPGMAEVLGFNINFVVVVVDFGLFFLLQALLHIREQQNVNTDVIISTRLTNFGTK